jgi:hypothetical protein
MDCRQLMQGRMALSCWAVARLKAFSKACELVGGVKQKTIIKGEKNGENC